MEFKEEIDVEFRKLPMNAEKVLHEILEAENPANMLCERFKDISQKDDEILRGILRQLREEGYIIINWADNVPSRVIINNSARTYNEQLIEFERNKAALPPNYYINHSINIGDGNKIKGTTIGGKHIDGSEKRKTFYENHPIIVGVLISVIAGVVLMFSFWEKVIEFIEGVF